MRAVLLCGLIVLLISGAAHRLVASRPTEVTIRLDSPPLPVQASKIAAWPCLRVAVAPILMPGYNFLACQELAEQLAVAVHAEAQLIHRATYAQIDELLAHDETDVAFIGIGNFLSSPGVMDLLAKPLVHGKPEFYSLIIVPAASSYHSLSDLRGKTFLYTDRDSSTGHAAVLKSIRETAGIAADDFFGATKWTGSHDRSVQAVAWGLADGAAVSSIAFDVVLAGNAQLAERVRVIDRLGPFPSPPVAVRKSLPQEQRQLLLKALEDLNTTPQGEQLLKSMGVERFVPARNEDYSVAGSQQP